MTFPEQTNVLCVTLSLCPSFLHTHTHVLCWVTTWQQKPDQAYRRSSQVLTMISGLYDWKLLHLKQEPFLRILLRWQIISTGISKCKKNIRREYSIWHLQWHSEGMSFWYFLLLCFDILLRHLCQKAGKYSIQCVCVCPLQMGSTVDPLA